MNAPVTLPNPETFDDGKGEREVRYARDHLRRMAIENPERLAMLRREWEDDDA